MRNVIYNNNTNNINNNCFNESFIGKNLVFIRLDKKRLGKVDYIDLIDELILLLLLVLFCGLFSSNAFATKWITQSSVIL